MPTSFFFATKADLTPGLEALQKKRPLQFVRCTSGGRLDGPSVPTYTSLLDATDLDHLQFRTRPGRDIDRLDLIDLYVLDADILVSVEERRIGEALPDGGTISYRVVIPEDAPCVVLTPGGLQMSPRALWCGLVEAEYTNAEEIRLYRQIVEALFQGFKQIGGYYYGSEALSLGAAGVPYAYVMHEPYKPWTYEDVRQSELNATTSANKPKSGRLSLEESWNWLEAYGYEVPRHADGTPHPYRRRPRCDDDPVKGLSFFRTFIDEVELDHLTLPRTYIGKSRAYQTSFKQSDLSRSRFAANQFAYCDFTEADLSGAYLASFFFGCTFARTVLTQADIRWSSFEDCTFTGAKMTGAKLLLEQAKAMQLSEEQKSEIVWKENAGPMPSEF